MKEIKLIPDSKSIAYLESNFLDSNTSVVCFHGLGCDATSFSGLMEEFGEKYHIVAPSYFGYGESDIVNNYGYILEDHALVMSEFIEACCHENIIIIAHSMGGAIALLTSRLMKKNLIGFVNIEGNLISESCGIFSRRLAAHDWDRFSSKSFPEFMKNIGASEKVGWKLWKEQLERCHSHAFYNSMKSLVHRSDSGELISIYNDLTCKKLYMYGSESKVEAELQAITSECISIQDSGHFPMQENEDEFHAQIKTFLHDL